MMLFPQITHDEDIHLDVLDETNPTLISQGRNVLTDTNGKANPGNKAPPCLSAPILADTEDWSEAMLQKHFQTAWDLGTQTNLGNVTKNEFEGLRLASQVVTKKV